MPDFVVNLTGGKRKIQLDCSPPPEKPAPKKVVFEAKKTEAPQKKETSLAKPRNGNGHASTKKRNLSDPEKDRVRKFFLLKTGIIEDDDCVEFHKELDQDLGIFQITGFISYLHREVAMGKITFPSAAQSLYEEFMKQRHNLWATYNSPKYVAMRQGTLKINDPVFTTFPKKVA